MCILEPLYTDGSFLSWLGRHHKCLKEFDSAVSTVTHVVAGSCRSLCSTVQRFWTQTMDAPQPGRRFSRLISCPGCPPTVPTQNVNLFKHPQTLQRGIIVPQTRGGVKALSFYHPACFGFLLASIRPLVLTCCVVSCTCRFRRPWFPLWTSACPAAGHRLCSSQKKRQTSWSYPVGCVRAGVREGREQRDPRGRPLIVPTGTYLTVSLLLFQAEVEIQQDAVAPGQKVLIIDDLLATGGERCTGQRCASKTESTGGLAGLPVISMSSNLA